MSVAELAVLGYAGLLALAWAGLLASTGGWGRRWPLPRSEGAIGASIAVCIPARNERHGIARCVRAALDARGFERFEVIVVDDRSTDGTAGAARVASDPRLRVVTGDPPEPGWAGKAWACARAAREARGDWLLFVDADVVLDPDAPSAMVAEAARRDLALLSAFGTWELVSFWERAAIPAIGWFVRGSVDLDRVNDPTRPEAFANGQVLLVRRSAYDSLGGHGAVRASVLDDVHLARAFKSAGHPIGIVAAPWAFRVRLYRSLAEIVAGYGKNLYAGMDRRPGLLVAAIATVVIGSLAPWALLPLVHGVPLLALSLVCALQLAFRFRIERRDGRSGLMAWSHPLGSAVLLAALVRSGRGRATWKGRSFEGGSARK